MVIDVSCGVILSSFVRVKMLCFHGPGTDTQLRPRCHVQFETVPLINRPEVLFLRPYDANRA